MTNAEITARFFASTDDSVKWEVLANIAKHYGITGQEAFEEVTGDDAEHLLDYLTGQTRTAISLLMQRHRLAA